LFLRWHLCLRQWLTLLAQGLMSSPFSFVWKRAPGPAVLRKPIHKLATANAAVAVAVIHAPQEAQTGDGQGHP